MVEMMVVIAVIGILALLAIPSFQGRIIRQQIEVALPGRYCKKAHRHLVGRHASLSTRQRRAGLPSSEKIVNNTVSALSGQDGAFILSSAIVRIGQ